jgi:hypothetical protein
MKGWQRYGTRLQKWLALSGEEIAELVSNGEKRNKLSSIDIACVRQAAAIIGGEQWLDALEKGLDRIEGKPLNRNELSGPNGGPLVVADEHRSAVRSRLISPPADGTSGSETGGAE